MAKKMKLRQVNVLQVEGPPGWPPPELLAMMGEAAEEFYKLGWYEGKVEVAGQTWLVHWIKNDHTRRFTDVRANAEVTFVARRIAQGHWQVYVRPGRWELDAIQRLLKRLAPEGMPQTIP